MYACVLFTNIMQLHASLALLHDFTFGDVKLVCIVRILSNFQLGNSPKKGSIIRHPRQAVARPITCIQAFNLYLIRKASNLVVMWETIHLFTPEILVKSGKHRVQSLNPS